MGLLYRQVRSAADPGFTGPEPAPSHIDPILARRDTARMGSANAVTGRLASARAELAAARLRASAATLRITQARREYGPSPDVALGLNRWVNMAVDSGPDQGNAIHAAVALPLPLFDRGQGRLDRAAAEEQAARVRSEALELAVRRETERALHAANARVASWRSYRDATSGQVDRLRWVAESSYREGKSAILELLDAYRAHLEAKERAVELRAAAWQSHLALEGALGPPAAR